MYPWVQTIYHPLFNLPANADQFLQELGIQHDNLTFLPKDGEGFRTQGKMVYILYPRLQEAYMYKICTVTILFIRIFWFSSLTNVLIFFFSFHLADSKDLPCS